MKHISIRLGLAVFLGMFGAAALAESEPSNASLEEIRAGGQKACDDGGEYTIAYSHSVSEANIVRQVRRFADKRAEGLRCVTILHDNTQANNLEQQINAVQAWITQGVDAIVVTPIDESALKPFQKQAQAQGIKWLTYLGTMDDSDGYVGFDHAQSGQMIAQAAIGWAEENGIEDPKVFITTLTGLPSLMPRATEAERLFREAGIDVVAMQDAADQATGLKVTETVLQQHPDLDIIIGLNDDAAVGANRAATIADLDPQSVFIGGQDGSYEALVAINEGGYYKASAAILINELGANIVDLALNAITGNGPSFAYTPTVLAEKSDQELLDRLIANYESN